MHNTRLSCTVMAGEGVHRRGTLTKGVENFAELVVHNKDTANLTLMLVETILHHLQWNSLDKGLKDCGLLPQQVNGWMLLNQGLACGQERLLGSSSLGPTIVQLAKAAFQAKSGVLSGDSLQMLHQLSDNANQLLGNTDHTKNTSINKVTDTLHGFKLPEVMKNIQDILKEPGGWVSSSLTQLLGAAVSNPDKNNLRKSVSSAYENAHALASKQKAVLDDLLSSSSSETSDDDDDHSSNNHSNKKRKKQKKRI